jgi:hypothetical protein
VLLLRFEYDRDLYNDLVSKLKRVSARVPIHVDVFRRNVDVYVLALDDGFSCAFLYAAYLRAKEKGLKPSLAYVRFIDEGFLPDDVKELGRKWAHGKLSWKEIEKLKGMSITEHVFSKW